MMQRARLGPSWPVCVATVGDGVAALPDSAVPPGARNLLQLLSLWCFLKLWTDLVFIFNT